MDEARAVREYWFGPVPLTPQALGERTAFWFGGSAPEERARRDLEIGERFAALLERAASGALAAWADGSRRRLSLIVLLDQFPRHIFRGTARAFAYDAQALALTLSGMQSGADGALDAVERLFFYMPLQHAESREVQEEAVAAFRRLLAEAPTDLRPTFEAAKHSADEHRSLIERFGRFPHRNAALQRATTPAEEEWLRQGSGFGQ